MMKTHHSKILTTLVLLIALSTFNRAFSQSLPYAREVVKALTSKEFYGRGYINKGDSIAADYIKEHLRSFGAKPVGDSYYQPFTMSVNTFPEPILLKIDDQDKQAGIDYLVHPASSSISGTFGITRITLQDVIQQQQAIEKIRNSAGTFIVLDAIEKDDLNEYLATRLEKLEKYLLFNPGIPAVGTIILQADKLTWFGSQEQLSKTVLMMSASSFPEEAQEIQIEINAELLQDYQSQNVIASIDGVNNDSSVVVIAHYDHFGKMGDARFPGANDNASGTAMLLSLARYYSKNTPPYKMIFIAFGGEEIGLLGSDHFTEHPTFDLDSIKFLLNFDLAGTGDEGIQVVNGSVYRSRFDSLVALNDKFDLLPEIRIRGKACNSDHCMFDHKDVPGFYMYTLGGIKAYHDVYDRFETLPFTEFEDYFKLITLFIDSL